MRIAGLASGMDIESMVKNLMKAERMPLDKLKQKKQILEWQRDDYRSLNTKLLSFRDKLSNLKLTTNYRSRTVTSSNDSFVSATVTSGASQASYSISEVKQLASAAVMKNTGKVSTGEKIDPNKSLKSQQFGTAIKWDVGVVDSQTINVKEDNFTTLKLDLKEDNKIKFLEGDSPNIKDNPQINVKVNGKSYKAVLDSKQILDENEVAVDENGNLRFGAALPKNATVKVDYALDKKTQEINVGNDVPLKAINLGRPINNDNVFGIKVTLKDNDGEEETTLNLSIGNSVDDEDGFYYLMEGSRQLGKINPTTGAIRFDEEDEQFKDGVPPGAKIEITYTQNFASFDIQTQTSKGEVNEKIFMTENDTLNSVIRKVNESTAGVTMYYDSFTDQVTLTRKETGAYDEEGKKQINVNGQFMTGVLKFDNDSGYETAGQNAIFTINGLETQRNTNTFEMSGVTFTLKQTFKETAGAQPVSISVGNDTNQVFENIKAFVTQYNELIAEINGKLNEDRYRSYKPLTDDEREGLSEKQQEKWEEMARSGLLKGDSVLSSVLSSMRIDMSSVIETNGLFKQLASIGIKTTANYLEGGKLEIDEAKLKEALEKDPQSVENLFRGDGTTSDRGVVHRLYDTVDATMKKLQEKAGRATSTNQQFTIGRELDNVSKGITRFEQKMKLTEERYWKQFTAMEKAIQRANEQSNYLWQQFGG
ncbi:flagellar filament capping protein FliD [Bacillus sp. FJAT-49732]|uniref:Flagellar hook-associated protein 2 n=1 Tax=Lederbergia citrisecunda TaxID=2833583 RepID=A0A942TQS7_9BACI|nr:flagellar filament capping protein FliD [Lederbergia citrisecunda]MBS4200377.1 flagellar filament capping protein FliD [Lederbergia citrisecunda]